MSTMPSTMSFHAQFALSKSHKRNPFLRIVDAIAETDRRRAEREITAFWARHDSQVSTGISS
jgi:hypothetical protein